MDSKAKIGLIGLAVMGANLARNLADKKIPTIVFNRTSSKTEEFIKKYGNKYLSAETNLQKFIEKIEKPRKIIIMVKAGESVDSVIKELNKFLDKEDIIIDCGNSNFADTERRQSNVNFIGCGVSGGEEGALHGPSLMPGGNKKAWLKIKPILQKIAAKDFNNQPCISYIGKASSGHYVKMVHNGIEYGVMQLMAETYDLLRNMYDLSAPEIAQIFKTLNQGKLNSYLFEIAEKVLKHQEKSGYTIDYILDKAAQKGTGAWTIEDSLNKNVALPTITEAVFARYISAKKEQRIKLNKIYPQQKLFKIVSINKSTELLENALYSAILITYAQGFDLILTASLQNKWNINLSEVARIWQGGCILRAKILSSIHQGFKKNPHKHLLEIPGIAQEIKTGIADLREVTALGIKNEIPLPALSSTVFYFDSMKQKDSPANFIQGLRDFFGAHTYERIDKKEIFHTNWQ